jgi:hypothetical protein
MTKAPRNSLADPEPAELLLRARKYRRLARTAKIAWVKEALLRLADRYEARVADAHSYNWSAAGPARGVKRRGLKR